MSRVYWFFPLIIFIAQAVYTKVSANQIRLEEVIETFRSVWWFQNGLVWNGSYSLLGWYATLAAVYNTFGMSIYTPKMVKLAVEFVSYFALAAVLAKYFGKRAWLPILVIGLSPTFMYFNSLQISQGVEVSYFFICLWFLTNLNFEKRVASVIGQIFLWGLAMFAWLSYPGFIFYLPLLGVGYLYKLRKKFGVKISSWFNNLSISAGSFVLPLLLLFIYIKNKELLIHDPLLGKGLFRSFAKIELAPDVWISNLRFIFRDLFISPTSYYFEAYKVEFSDFYPIFSIVAVLAGLVMMIRRGKSKGLILFLLIVLLVYFVLISLVGPKTLGGIRRGTILLVIFYGLLAIVWDWVLRLPRPPVFKKLLTAGIFLILVHHLIIYPVNLRQAQAESVFREKWWFWKDHPERTLTELVDIAKTGDIVLPCIEGGKDSSCPGLSLIYPAIAGYCFWNDLKCNQVLIKSSDDQYVPIDLGFWGVESHAEP